MGLLHCNRIQGFTRIFHEKTSYQLVTEPTEDFQSNTESHAHVRVPHSR